MEVIRYLISKIILLIPIILLLFVMYWIGSKLAVFLPEGALSTLNPLKGDVLPPPRNNMPTTNPLTSGYMLDYTPPEDTYNYTTNTSQTRTESSVVFNANQAGFSQTELFIRNISVYRGQSIAPSFTFTGEARETLFSQGRFMLYLVTKQGQIVGTGEAVAVDQWSIPGWHRFNARIISMNGQGECFLIFKPASSAYRELSIPVTCAPQR